MIVRARRIFREQNYYDKPDGRCEQRRNYGSVFILFMLENSIFCIVQLQQKYEFVTNKQHDLPNQQPITDIALT